MADWGNMVTRNERGQFATVLQQYRAKAGLSQEELAERAGLSKRGISDLERGVRRAPHPATARRLADALGLTEPDKAHLLAAARTPHGEPSASGSGDGRDNLPVQLTRFIGSAGEIAALCRELQQTRLLTLCGPGGVGKTRLALEVGRQEVRVFDGVWFVELGALADSTVVPQLVARTLSIREIPGEPVLTTLTRALRDAGLLLILDHCEHLLQASADLVDHLLRGCPRLRVLATSREVLTIPGEHVWRVRTLSQPDASVPTDMQRLPESKASELFMERAAMASGFEFTRRDNLPAELTPFIGRQAELIEVRRLLVTTRLLTLSGAGGVGKTRLALHCAREVIDEYPDGVWLVEMASVADPLLVPKAVADALAVSEQVGRSVRDSLVDRLRAKRILLVLDNCEHLVQACAELVDTLLRACPDIRVLATSRQRLHVTGETTWRVPSMSVPPAEEVTSCHSVATYDATRLFVERAVAVFPSFSVDDQNGGTVARICARLDGIPLAIELAAARASVLTPDQINERLSDCFRLLADANRVALPRHQTLRATLDWSFALLSGVERALFSQLAVFAGGWTLEAAEAVCAAEAGELSGGDVLEVLAGLVDKSLVAADHASDVVRYRMLETVRAYAWEKLRARGEERAVRDRHCAWFATLAARADGKIRGRDQAASLASLEREHDNLRAALAWSVDTERVENALRLAGDLAWFWRIHGHIGEGRRWLTLALGLPYTSPPLGRARALNGAGLLIHAQGDAASAERLLAEGLRVARERGDIPAEGWALHGLGRVAELSRDFGRATAVLEESLRRFRDLDDSSGCAYSLLHLANIARDSDDNARARALYAEALKLGRDNGDGWVLGWTLAQAAYVDTVANDMHQATALYLEGLVILHKIQAVWGIAECLMGLTGLAGASGQPDRAARLFGAEQSLRERVGGITDCYGGFPAHQAGLIAAQESLGAQRFDALAREGRAMSLDEVVTYALTARNDAQRASLAKAGASKSTPRSAFPLSVREREVAVLLAQGLSNREVARALVITPRTADTHVMNILTKLRLHSRAQVAAWAAQHGLLPATNPGNT
jgi:non-specific serine/threonine protein kinase